MLETLGIKSTYGLNSLEDKLKTEHFLKVKDKYRYFEFEKALPE